MYDESYSQGTLLPVKPQHANRRQSPSCNKEKLDPTRDAAGKLVMIKVLLGRGSTGYDRICCHC